MVRATVFVMCVVLAVLATLAFAGKFEDMKQACDMCGNINMGGSGSKQSYVCPKDAVKECNININGWCCSKKRASPKCKPCWDLNNDDDDDEEEM
jgi:hypothetical protein